MKIEGAAVMVDLRKWVRIVIVVAAFSSASLHADSVDDYIHQQLQSRHIPGLSLAVVKDGKVVKAEGYGLANIELNVPASSQSVYQLASLTKQFTASAIMLLVQDKKLKLDDKVSQYVDSTPASWKDISLRELLNQTSGIKDYLNEHVGSPTSSITARNDITAKQIIDSVASQPLQFTPGEKFDYSNINYALLSMVIQKVSGKPYGQFLAERVFEPAGLPATRQTSHDDIIPNRVAGYTWADGKLHNAAWLNPTLWDNGDGGIDSTAVDLAKWSNVIAGESILTESSKQQMWAPPTLNNGKPSNYGFGWGLAGSAVHRYVWHSGGRPGTSTAIFRYLNDNLTVVVLVNLDNASPASIAKHVALTYLPTTPVAKDDVAAQKISAILDGLSKENPSAELFPPRIPVGGSGFDGPIKSIKNLIDGVHHLGIPQSTELLESSMDGDARKSRYRVTYPTDLLVVECTINQHGAITALSFDRE